MLNWSQLNTTSKQKLLMIIVQEQKCHSSYNPHISRDAQPTNVSRLRHTYVYMHELAAFSLLIVGAWRSLYKRSVPSGLNKFQAQNLQSVQPQNCVLLKYNCGLNCKWCLGSINKFFPSLNANFPTPSLILLSILLFHYADLEHTPFSSAPSVESEMKGDVAMEEWPAQNS